MDQTELFAYADCISQAFKDTEPMAPDEIDFSWWNDDDLLNFAFDRERTIKLNEDDNDALIYALARRLNDVLGQEI